MEIVETITKKNILGALPIELEEKILANLKLLSSEVDSLKYVLYNGDTIVKEYSLDPGNNLVVTSWYGEGLLHDGYYSLLLHTKTTTMLDEEYNKFFLDTLRTRVSMMRERGYDVEITVKSDGTTYVFHSAGEFSYSTN